MYIYDVYKPVICLSVVFSFCFDNCCHRLILLYRYGGKCYNSGLGYFLCVILLHLVVNIPRDGRGGGLNSALESTYSPVSTVQCTSPPPLKKSPPPTHFADTTERPVYCSCWQMYYNFYTE